MNGLVLGFDARLDPAAYVGRSWDSERRETFLLRPEIAWPKSVDKTVWPAVLRLPGDVDLGAQGVVEIEPVDVRHNALDVWRDLASLETALKRSGATGRGYALMISVYAEDPIPSDHVWKFAEDEPADAVDIADGWVLLGFDVADTGLVSALMNCGFDASERGIFRGRWAETLNEHGLFASRADARAFRDTSDQRVAAHAPFSVFALHAKLTDRL